MRDHLNEEPELTEEKLKEYEELEKKFLGDPDKKTGIYAEHTITGKLTAFTSEE